MMLIVKMFEEFFRTHVAEAVNARVVKDHAEDNRFDCRSVLQHFEMKISLSSYTIHMQNRHWQRKLPVKNCGCAQKTLSLEAGFIPDVTLRQGEEVAHSMPQINSNV